LSRERSPAAEFLGSTSGKAGLGLVIVFTAISIYTLATYPLDFGTRFWSNPTHWADFPKVVPPSWIGLIDGQGTVEHQIYEARTPDQISSTRLGQVMTYNFYFNHQSDRLPTFLSVSIRGITFWRSPPIMTVKFERPDGLELVLQRLVPPAARAGESPPYVRYSDGVLRSQLSSSPEVANAVASFARSELNLTVKEADLLLAGPERILFRARGEDEVLKGRYRLSVDVSVEDPRDSVDVIRFVVGGSRFGLLGTDGQGRDIAQGLLFGFPVALFIGVTVSVLATGVGGFAGIASGFIGGKTDNAIQRASDILTNVPLLPILIFLTFILGQKLWVVLLILVAFSWPGLTIIVRSMVLQLKSGQLIEAARSLGASRVRIMVRHIFPQIAPYILAQLIFFAPAAILAEAALSFLGLGDPTVPTWGQILQQGFQSGAVYVGHWWWILPPGFLIVLTASAFILISLGLETVINPKLRRMA